MITLQRSSWVLLFVSLKLMIVSGFHVFSPKTRTNSLLSTSPPLVSANARKNSVITFMATPQEEQAVEDFKMITEEESNLRKIGGIVIGVATAAAFFTQDQSYSSLSAGTFAAISTYRTGAEYQ